MNKTINRISLFLIALIIISALIIYLYPNANIYIPLFLESMSQFLGTFFGVMAGIIITYTVQNISSIQQKNQLTKNFILEMKINIKKIDNWLKEFKKYRNAVNGDSLQNYNGYFKLSSFLGVATNQLHVSGEAYHLLNQEQFKDLEEVYNGMDVHGENYLNNQVQNNKNDLATNMDEWASRIKPSVVNEINFWEEKLTSHSISLTNIVQDLENKHSKT